MGQHATAYVFYGFRAPDGLDEQEMEEALSKKLWHEAGYLMAGPYDGPKQAYVATFCEQAGAREAVAFEFLANHHIERHRAELLDVADANGWPVPEPKWTVAADVS